ncbi:glutathione S-transferase family protein [Undibacterium terreum]|uniref:Glutathione S-transferase n=1 Tax=Undibacterium terreum TaxID=1224302 RepID=A0A916XRC4_9BURK|nr:glutathione S-transferase [Undibacterium terreum]GGC96146.1 glutathione S-transferase [Undibacterium terreum]
MTSTSRQPADITLHGTIYSGHCHRVELLLTMLQIPYRFVEAAASKRATPEFLQLNPLGQIPVLQDGELTLTDSNAILVYLVKRYAPNSQWLSDDPVTAAQIQRWFSIAAGEVKFGPCTARMALQWNAPGDPVVAAGIANRLFQFMEQYLAERSYLAAEYPTLADLACYSYIAHAPEGRIPLEPYPNLRAWLARIEALPNFKAMPKLPVPAAA